jgi:hypothetical protein
MTADTSKESVILTWVCIIALAVGFLIFNFFAYRVVGDAGQPTWNYGTVKDVPAESPYGVYEKLPHPQHVLGAEGE